jgi:hypothetical protein
MAPRRFVFALLVAAACGPAPNETTAEPAPLQAASDPCEPPTFTEPDCFSVHDTLTCWTPDDTCPLRVVCPMPDGTEWTRLSTGSRLRYEVVEGTHAPAKILCDFGAAQ